MGLSLILKNKCTLLTITHCALIETINRPFSFLRFVIRLFHGPLIYLTLPHMRPLHGDWCVFCLLIHCIIGSYFVYLSIKNSIIFLPWHTNPRIPMSM
ncbi:hypothetical protein CS549_05710 [Porphyromonas gingivalis]|nr:hypothetical protein CS549_05710 [Porphyromonas gingivalis]